MTRMVVLAAWALVALLLAGCVLLSRVCGGRYARAQDVLGRLARGNVRFVAVYVAWMWVGWHFFAR